MMTQCVEARPERAVAASEEARPLPLSICVMLVSLALREEEARKGCAAEKTRALR